LLASRLFGHRFHSFVSSALFTCSRSVYFPQMNVFRTHHDANNLLQLPLQNIEKWWIHRGMYHTIHRSTYYTIHRGTYHTIHRSTYHTIHQIIFKSNTTAIWYQKMYPDNRWWWKLVCKVLKLMCHKYM
jgi:hypothetical protein